MQSTGYRTRLLLDVFRALILPSVVILFVLHLAGVHPPLSLAFPLCLVHSVLWAVARINIISFRKSMEAKGLGARPIPRVVGKWPGNIDVLLRMLRAFKTSYLLDVYLDLFQEYKCTTLNMRILWVDFIITMDQEHAKFILSTGFDHFWRGRAQKERMETFLGNGIFNRDDEIWKMHRAMARPFFARERISDFDIFERYSSRTISILSSLASSGVACEAQDLYSRFTLDAASEFLFGKNLDTLSASLPVPGHTPMGPKGSATHDTWGSFAQSFEMVQQVITSRSRIGYFWPFFELLQDNTACHVKIIRNWLDPIVKQVLENKICKVKSAGHNSINEKTFLQHLADNTEDVGTIRDQLLNILLASRDTTASLLTYITYFMAIYPEITKKLRAEVLLHCGPDGAPTYQSIRNLKYMRAVIHETLRLFPPVPLNVRESRRSAFAMPPSDASYPSDSTSLHPEPLYMPGSTSIMFFPMLIQRNTALWGPDADIFDPDRWLDPKRLAKFTTNPTMFAPFSAGPRICVGQNYAYNEASYFLVRLLQQFDSFTLAPDLQPEGSLPPPIWKTREGRQRVERIWPGAALTLYVKGGLWVRFGKSMP